MNRVTARDGTSIAYGRHGSGPPIILIGGALASRSAGVGNNAPLAAELAAQFTVYNYDRRGRGESEGRSQHSVEREIDDLDALIAVAGGSPHLYGVSSGGVLALEAAAAGVRAGKVAVYEVPYGLADPARLRSYREELDALLTVDRRSDALELFHRLLGIPEEAIAAARQSPLWPGAVALAHTLSRDAAVLGDGQVPAARLAKISQPVLVATGGGYAAVEEAADVTAASIPHAERLTLQSMEHAIDAKALAPVLQRFFNQ